MTEVHQVFVRNESGQVWGPLALATLELLLENGVITGRILVSEDGLNFAFPARFPHLREVIPPELWGDASAPPQRVNMTPAAGTPRLTPAPLVPAPMSRMTPAPLPRMTPVPISRSGATPSPSGTPVPTGAATTGAATDVSAQKPSLPPAGDLARISPIRLYALAAQGQQTGRLALALADRTIQLHFRKGNPDAVESSHPEDSLEAFLIEQNLITPEQLAPAKAAGGDLLTTLFAQGVLQPATAFTQLVKRSSAILLKGLSAESGTFSFHLEELPPQKSMPLGHRWGVLSDALRKIAVGELKRRLASVSHRPLLRAAGGLEVQDLKLTPQETRALGHFDGVRSLEQVIQAAPQDAETVLRLAFLLLHLGVVTLGNAPARAGVATSGVTGTPRTTGSTSGGRPTPSGAPTSPTASGAARAGPSGGRPTPPAHSTPPATRGPDTRTPPTEPPAVATAAELRAKLEEMRKQNHFQRLGIKESADPNAAKLAYFKLARLYHPDTATGGAGEEALKLKADIFGLIGDAYRILTDEKAREKYVEELKSGVGDIDLQQLLKAEEIFHRATLQVKGKRFAEGLKLLDEAILLNPAEGEFYAWRGFARFFTIQDKRLALAEATKDLQLALKKNEKCAAAYFYSGQLAKLCGDNASALRHFKKTVDLQPSNIDAQRELRLLSKK